MNLHQTGSVTTVTLSERNLRDLLAQIEASQHGSLGRSTTAGTLVVLAESDAVHYAERPAGFGSGLVPRAADNRRKCTGSGIARDLTRGMPGLPWMRKCPHCGRYLDENGGNRLPTHYVSRTA